MRFNLRLHHKIQLLLLGFVVALGGVAVVLLLGIQQRIVNRAVSADVQRARPLVERFIRKRSLDLIERAQFVADLPTLRSAMIYTHGDPATIHQRFQVYQVKLKADSFFITDDIGRMITFQGRQWRNLGSPQKLAGVATAIEGKSWSGAVDRGGVLMFGVSVPVVVAGYVKGTINVFDAIDAKTSNELASDLGLGIAILQRHRVIAASVPGVKIELLPNSVVDATAGRTRFVGMTLPLPGADPADQVSLVALDNYDELVAPFREIGVASGLVLLAIFMLAALLSRTVSNRIVAQIESLLNAAQTLRDGRWPQPIEVNRSDEIGLLQTSFNEMSYSLKAGHDLLLNRTEELREALARAELAGKARTEFLASISHEFRTPLNAALGMGQILESSELKPEQLEYAHTMTDNVEKLLCLVNEVLSYAELESGRTLLQPSTFDLTALLTELCETHGAAAAKKGLEFKNPCLDGSLPLVMKTDRPRLLQLLDQLLANAIKFTDSGFVGLRVSQNEGRLTIDVQDTGCGIPEDRLEQVFLPFRQADNSSTRSFGGTGLGLAICARIATLMGADLAVSSVQGIGSTFTFSMPFSPDFGDLESAVSNPESPTTFRVLIVDDNPTNVKVAAKICERLGCVPICASGGAEGVDLAATGFDLILMDCHMPDLDGFEATRQIRGKEHSCNRRTPIFALTASSLDEDRARAAQAGMDGYLVKPLRVEMIASLKSRLYSKAA